MKYLIFVLMMVLAAASAEAQCALSNVHLLPLGPQFGTSDQIMPGDEVYLGFDAENTNPGGCAAITTCVFAQNQSIPGKPVPTYMVVLPVTSSPACVTLNSNSAALVLVHVTTSQGGSTPPFEYDIKTWMKLNGTLSASEDELVTVLDPYGNTCARAE